MRSMNLKRNQAKKRTTTPLRRPTRAIKKFARAKNRPLGAPGLVFRSFPSSGHLIGVLHCDDPKNTKVFQELSLCLILPNQGFRGPTSTASSVSNIDTPYISPLRLAMLRLFYLRIIHRINRFYGTSYFMRPKVFTMQFRCNSFINTC